MVRWSCVDGAVDRYAVIDTFRQEGMSRLCLEKFGVDSVEHLGWPDCRLCMSCLEGNEWRQRKGNEDNEITKKTSFHADFFLFSLR